MMRNERIEERASVAAIALVFCLTSGRGQALEAASWQDAEQALTAQAGPTLLDPGIVEQVEGFLGKGSAPEDVRPMAMELYDASIAAHGDLEHLLGYLEGRSVEGASDGLRHVARRLIGYLAWRHGDLSEALKEFQLLTEESGDLDARLARARVLDANGKAKEALAAYGEIVNSGDLEEDVELATRLRLRMALMSMESGEEDQKDALANFAREGGRAVSLRNRCATVLALLGRPGDAADLYVVGDPPGEEVEISERKQGIKAAANGELRVAEWALRAGDYPRAQEAAWRAVHLATVARERRYGLTLLAEAHRGDDSLPKLLERFSTEREGLPPEARRAWIELLRETGSTDEAIAMTQGDQAQTFSKDERRRLLEMYREADREEEMIAVYREWISGEPEELVWRQGLARHFLEEGDRDSAIAVWEEWFARSDARDGHERAPELDAAEVLEGLGLDDLAMLAAEEAIQSGSDSESAFLFLYDLHRDRGRLEQAREALTRLDAFAEPGSPARMPLSDCLERLGELEQAIRVLEDVRAARGVGNAGEDLEMRLAWLYSEDGREEEALVLWKDIWVRVKSLARRRFVEDRMMTVASRLGVLADIAVELERKLFEGLATQKDSGLLVRLYTKVGDSVSAAEIVDEFLRRTGGSELEALTEKARIYLACNDYYHYEKAVERLVELDPEGRPDYYRQLAMSQLERGKPDQARATLMNLQDLPGGDDSSAEFEAGVLALSGMREEAIGAYRRGLAAHPERIDSYLLMANLMKQVRQSDRAVGMFQHLAETAERDDLFTIAIDGLLNMLVDAPPRPEMVEWARRITLERLAAKQDRPYLYQLLADLAEETEDEKGQLTALENSLASAGPRRASVLRELMELCKPAAAGFGSRKRSGDRSKQLAFGRRLVGLAELVPPDVYLDLGDAFLEEDDEASAARTFDLTREFPDGELYQQQAAERFERAGFIERGLDRYQAVLAASPTDVPLLAKVGEMRESLGDDQGALDLYRRAYDVLLRRKPLFEGAQEEEDERPYFARNVDDYEQHIERVLIGVLSALSDDEAVLAFLGDQRATLERELPEALAAAAAAQVDEAQEDKRESEETGPSFASHPRLVERTNIVRRIAFATGNAVQAEELDRWALEAFPGDEKLLEDALVARVRWGRFAAARKLVDDSGVEGERRDALLARLGQDQEVESSGSRRVPFDTAISAMLPTFASGDIEVLRSLVRRTDLTKVEKEAVGRLAVVFAAARATEDPQLQLSIGREWLRLELEHKSYPYKLEQRIDTILNTLDSETGLALARSFVSRVLEDPEQNSQFVTLLPKLTQKFDEEVVDPEDVRTLLDGFGDRYAWGLGPVLALLPAPERAGALRGVWSKLEASNRADFLIELVCQSTEEIPGELADFVTESLPEALTEADDFIKYSVDGLLELEHSHALCVKMAQQIIEAKPGITHVRAYELVHRHALEEEGLAEKAAEVWIDLALDAENDYYKRRARERLVKIFGEASIEDFLAALDQRAESGGDSSELARARVDLLLDVDRDEEAAGILDTALEEEPKDVELLKKRRSLHQRRGERSAAARILERMAETAEEEGKEDEHKRHLKALVREWTSLHAPELALAAKQQLGDEEEDSGGIPGLPAGFVLPPGASIMVNGVMYTAGDAKAKKGLPKSFKDVREALAEEDEEQAGQIFRRLWRQFPVGQPKMPRFYSPYRRRNLTLANLKWPAEEREEESEAEEKEPTKGGALAFDPSEPEDPPEPPNAYERIAESATLVAEQRRFLRTVEAQELDRLQGLIEGLLSVEVREAGGELAGEKAVLDALLERADAGETGRADQIRLLAMLDRSPDQVTGAAAEALSDLVRTIPPRDAAQVRRLARVLLQSGDEAVALRLYHWCALLASGSGRFVDNEEELDVVTSVSDRELVKEARDHLTGEARLRLIELVLNSARPVDSPWARESYEQLVLDTWDEVVEPQQALERSREIVEDVIDTSTGLRRRVARRAASIFLNAGDRERALRAVEVGIAKLPPGEVKQPEDSWYRSEPKLPGSLSYADFRRLMPLPTSDVPELGDWLILLSSSLEQWLQEDRVQVNNTVMALSLAAIRLGELGRPEEAGALALRLAEREDVSAGVIHWVIDALRATGAEDEAGSREQELLAKGSLHPERVAEVLSRIAASSGPAAVFDAVRPLEDFFRHEDAIEVLVAAAQALNDDDAAQLWRDRGAAAREAEAAMEELDDKKKDKKS